MQKKTIRVIVPCLAVIMAFAVAAAEIYVDPVVGTDAVGSGAAAVPFKTVGYALGRASAGDTIRLAAGIYSAAGGETFPIAFSSTKAHVRLMGAGPAATVFDGTGVSGVTCLTATEADGIVLSGFTISNFNTRAANTYPALNISRSQNFLVTNCTFCCNKMASMGVVYVWNGTANTSGRMSRGTLVDCNWYGNEFEAANILGVCVKFAFAQCVVDRCRFTGNRGTATESVRGTLGAWGNDGSTNPSVKVRNTLIADNGLREGRTLSNGEFTGGIYLSDKYYEVDNCTVVSNSGPQLCAANTGVHCLCRNTIVAGDAMLGLYRSQADGQAFTNVLTSSALPSGVKAEGCRIVSNLKLTADYRPYASTPAFDGGIMLDWMMPDTTDLEWCPRILSEKPDIGCFEIHVLHVDPVGGTDAVGFGTVSTPFKTVGYTLGKTMSGEAIRLLAGTYSAASGETFPIAITSANAGIRLMGAGPDETIFDGTGVSGVTCLTVTDADGLVLSGFNVSNFNTRAANTYPALNISRSQNFLVTNCTFCCNKMASMGVVYVWNGTANNSGRMSTGTLADCYWHGNEFVADNILGTCVKFAYAQCIIDRCRFVGNRGTASTTVRGAVGAWGDSATTLKIHNTLIADNGLVSGTLSQKEFCGGLFLSSGSFDVDNCTIASNSDPQCFEATGGTRLQMCNTILGGTPISFGDGATRTFKNVLTSAALPSGENAEGCIVAADLKLTADYHIRQSSPAFDAGIVLSWMDTDSVDLDGNPRIKLERPDIGCYEIQEFFLGTTILFR